jgi:methylthioribose-1-phosphate isomerase
MTSLQAIKYSDGKLEILNQLLLPEIFTYENCSDCELAFHAIKEMKVRGAPAIAITAALAIACEVNRNNYNSNQLLIEFILNKLNYLCQSRPTAVNLFKMADDVRNFLNENRTHLNLKSAFIHFCEKIFIDDIETNKRIGNFGAQEISKNNLSSKVNILTHCNTGSLATAGYGTALGVIRNLFYSNKLQHAFATETRPYNQGARLTAFELVYEKIPSTLITDSMVSFLMKTQKIDAVIVGADRVAANGDTANKIGTYQIAVLAEFHKVPFYVAAPTTSIDLKIQTGNEIHIEERPQVEVTHLRNIQIAAKGIHVWNPSFDVTPACLITGIITEYGIVYKNEYNQFNFDKLIKK